MIKIEELLKNAYIYPNQGYAMYFYYQGNMITSTNGKLKDDNSLDITLDTNFRLASVTKQFIAYCIVDLVLNNQLTFDTCILSIFNELPAYFKEIQIIHLLNHTSGIFDYEDMEHTNKQIKDIEIIDFLKTTKNTYFTPGTKYRYSNTAYILLGLIIERVSKMAISEYVNQNIFQKANMLNSSVNIEGKTNIFERAYGHILEDNNLLVKDQYWCSATIGDGGIYSSVNDLKKWCLFLSKSKHFEFMKKPNYINEEEYNYYGLGIRTIKFNNNEIHYHCGDTIGTNTLLLFSTDLNLCLIFLTNLNGIDTEIVKNNLLEILAK